MYLLGYDIGSSSVKAALVDAQTMEALATVHYPETEMEIMAQQPGWAEQDPETWWNNLVLATEKLFSNATVNRKEVVAIGISYQMHGLVLIDKQKNVLRPSIIWCDSRAVASGDELLQQLGEEYCLDHLLNTPGNFTASKLKWVKGHEPGLFDQIAQVMLPGDYINMKLTGEVNTTITALSEGMFWDFEQSQLSEPLLQAIGASTDLIPELADITGIQGLLSNGAAKVLGLKSGIPVAYRAGDQPNNAMALNVLKPGEVAATGGTSGVVFGVTDKLIKDRQGRLNAFAHVNHLADKPMLGLLLCINGAGSQYGWMRKMLGAGNTSYFDMEQMAATVPVGSDGLTIFPFGNGAERMLNNQDPGAWFTGLNFNRHSQPHFYRAALEGIAYSFVYGAHIMNDLGLPVSTMRVGNDNLFQSEIFSSTIASLLGCRIEMMETSGAVGAARASAVGAGLAGSLSEVMAHQQLIRVYEPTDQQEKNKQGYERWRLELMKQLN